MRHCTCDLQKLPTFFLKLQNAVRDVGVKKVDHGQNEKH